MTMCALAAGGKECKVKMKIIVQKFGGTSTRSVETREHMYKNIIRELDAGNKVVAVVSAMGRFDDPYARIRFCQLLILIS